MDKNGILQDIARNIAANQERIEEAKYLTGLLRDAGTDTMEQDLAIKELERKQGKWVQALRSRGVEIV